jgi:signal transduction histidine kinase/ActR/RegA family two-component response regulator
VSSVEHNPALRLRLLNELAQRVCWSSLASALFGVLFSVNLDHRIRSVALVLSGLLAVFGTVRALLARQVIAGQDTDHAGTRLMQITRIQSCTFGVFISYAMLHVNGQVLTECLLVVGVAGFSSASASMFAPFPRLSLFNVAVQLVPVYIWSVFALPRYGWLLPALMAMHALTVAQTILINGAHSRQMFLAQISLEEQSEDLRHARDAADLAASAKMRFLANMSHEIRTPLNGIMGLAEALTDMSLTPEQRAVLDDIGRSGHHLLAIVNDVLDMAKVSSGKLSVEQAAFDLRGLIRDVSSPAAALADTGKLRFLVDVPPDLPQQVQGDALRIRQVLSNLLSNAVKFTPAGDVRLAVERPRPGWVRFGVSDTGIGLSLEQQASLFQEFHQVDSSATRKFGGSGLGLAISHRLAGLMGGQLWVESRLGAGSTFFLEVPLPVCQAAPSPASPAPVVWALPAGLRVLVAEDNVVNQKVIAMLLKNVGASVEIAENGRAAVERHQASPYDVILMDCQMPELDGYEATARIRSLPGCASLVPIIGVTANAFAEDRDRCISAGMNGYVAKPVNRGALMAAMAQLLTPAGKE